MNERLQALAEKSRHIRSRMWKSHLKASSKKEAALYAFLRVAEISWQGISENRIVNRAAALSFSSMLAFAPVIVLMVLVAGFAVDKAGVDTVIDKLDNAIEFIAPQIENLEAINDQENQASGTANGIDDPASEDPAQNQAMAKVEDLLYSFIEESQQGTVGVAGVMVLILIVIQLFSTIEGAFNDIWGVRRGRSWVTRVGMYWTVITLGAVLVFAGLAILTTELAKLSGNVLESYTFLERWISILVKATSFTMIICILAVFYRFIPNTLVTWKAAFVGSIFAVICILLNNEFAFFYLERVVLFKSLYGPLSLIPVMMLGMFVFWFIILLGGRVTYAVQNAKFRSNKMAWDELSLSSKESLCLLLFARICRKFRNCETAPTATELAEVAGLPIQLINSSLTMLGKMGLVSSTPPEENSTYQIFRFQPAKPLDRIGLIQFKECFETLGSLPDKDLFNHHDPLVECFHKLENQALSQAFGERSIQSLLEELDRESDDDSGSKVEPISSGRIA